MTNPIMKPSIEANTMSSFDHTTESDANFLSQLKNLLTPEYHVSHFLNRIHKHLATKSQGVTDDKKLSAFFPDLQRFLRRQLVPVFLFAYQPDHRQTGFPFVLTFDSRDIPLRKKYQLWLSTRHQNFPSMPTTDSEWMRMRSEAFAFDSRFLVPQAVDFEENQILLSQTGNCQSQRIEQHFPSPPLPVTDEDERLIPSLCLSTLHSMITYPPGTSFDLVHPVVTGFMEKLNDPSSVIQLMNHPKVSSQRRDYLLALLNLMCQRRIGFRILPYKEDPPSDRKQ